MNLHVHRESDGMSYLEILDIRSGEPEETGDGRACRFGWQTWLVFWLCKLLLTATDNISYLLDYHDGNGRLVGTVFLDDAGYRRLMGTEAKEVTRA
jgi:hypothetical protein